MKAPSFKKPCVKCERADRVRRLFDLAATLHAPRPRDGRCCECHREWPCLTVQFARSAGIRTYVASGEPL